MGFFGVLMVGFIAGVLARLFVPGDGQLGWFATLLIGVAGSLFGGFLGKLMEGRLEVTATGLFGSVVGAVIVLVVYRMATSHLAASSRQAGR